MCAGEAPSAAANAPRQTRNAVTASHPAAVLPSSVGNTAFPRTDAFFERSYRLSTTQEESIQQSQSIASVR